MVLRGFQYLCHPNDEPLQQLPEPMIESLLLTAAHVFAFSEDRMLTMASAHP